MLALIALSYTGAEVAGGSPYLAAFIAGLIVGNKDLILHDRDHRQEAVLETYVEQTVDIVVLAIFVVLGLNLDVQALIDNLWTGLAVMVVFILLARPVTVAICLGLDRRSGWTRQEATFIAWCRETGVVPVAVASMLLAALCKEHLSGRMKDRSSGWENAVVPGLTKASLIHGASSLMSFRNSAATWTGAASKRHAHGCLGSLLFTHESK